MTIDLNIIRTLAGIPTVSTLLEKKKDKEEAEMAPPADDVDADAGDDADAAPKAKKGKGEKSDEEKLQEMLEKMAKKADGKSAEDLVPVFRKVYDAGVKDGLAQAKEVKEEVIETDDDILIEDDGELKGILASVSDLKGDVDKAAVKKMIKAAHKAGKKA